MILPDWLLAIITAVLTLFFIWVWVVFMTDFVFPTSHMFINYMLDLKEELKKKMKEDDRP